VPEMLHSVGTLRVTRALYLLPTMRLFYPRDFLQTSAASSSSNHPVYFFLIYTH